MGRVEVTRLWSMVPAPFLGSQDNQPHLHRSSNDYSYRSDDDRGYTSRRCKRIHFHDKLPIYRENIYLIDFSRFWKLLHIVLLYFKN